MSGERGARELPASLLFKMISFILLGMELQNHGIYTHLPACLPPRAASHRTLKSYPARRCYAAIQMLARSLVRSFANFHWISWVSFCFVILFVKTSLSTGLAPSPPSLHLLGSTRNSGTPKIIRGYVPGRGCVGVLCTWWCGYVQVVLLVLWWWWWWWWWWWALSSSLHLHLRRSLRVLVRAWWRD